LRKVSDVRKLQAEPCKEFKDNLKRFRRLKGKARKNPLNRKAAIMQLQKGLEF